MCRILKSVNFDDFAQTIHIGGWPAIAYFIEQYMHVFIAKGNFSYNTRWWKEWSAHGKSIWT